MDENIRPMGLKMVLMDVIKKRDPKAFVQWFRNWHSDLKKLLKETKMSKLEKFFKTFEMLGEVPEGR